MQVELSVDELKHLMICVTYVLENVEAELDNESDRKTKRELCDLRLKLVEYAFVLAPRKSDV